MNNKTKKDDPRRSEMCTMKEAQEILGKSHQHIRDLVLVHKRLREYPLAPNFKMYNIADLKKELKRQNK